jgi:hypothetical protein
MTSTASTSPAAVDLNSTTSTPADVSVPAILFAIPFPPASHPREDAASVAKRPAFLLYSPPRAVYRRPQAAAGDAKPKENLVKKFESKWQEEVAQGNAIGRGAVHDPSVWQKTKGVLTRVRLVGVIRMLVKYSRSFRMPRRSFSGFPTATSRRYLVYRPRRRFCVRSVPVRMRSYDI